MMPSHDQIGWLIFAFVAVWLNGFLLVVFCKKLK